MNKSLAILVLFLGGCATVPKQRDPVEVAMDYCADNSFSQECERRLLKALVRAAQVDDSPNYMSGFTRANLASEILVIR